MDPPPVEKTTTSKKPKKSQTDTSPQKERTGMKAKIKKKFGAKTKAKANVGDAQPTVGPETPIRRRAGTVIEQSLPSTEKTKSRDRSHSLSPSKPRSSSIIPSKKPKPALTPTIEPTLEKVITSESDLKKALNPEIKDLSSPENYKSIKIVTTSKDPLNNMEFLFQNLFQQYSRITGLYSSGLILGGTETGDLRMQNLVTALQFMLLEKLALENCGIHKTGMQRLASILVPPTHAASLYFADTLRVLELRGNKIDDVGIGAIVTALKKNAVLTNLFLDQNLIGDKGAKNLAGVLESNETLKVVYLTDNEITGEGILAFLEALPKRSNLSLYLSNNILEMVENYDLFVLENSLPETLCLIQKKQLALMVEEDSLYCKVFGQDKMKIPHASHPAQGLPLETLTKIISIIQTFLKDGDYVKALENLAPFKKKILRFTSGLGYTPLINDLQPYKSLMMSFATNNVQVYLPEVPPPYKAKRLDD